jgi:hypothetical protein
LRLLTITNITAARPTRLTATIAIPGTTPEGSPVVSPSSGGSTDPDDAAVPGCGVVPDGVGSQTVVMSRRRVGVMEVGPVIGGSRGVSESCQRIERAITRAHVVVEGSGTRVFVEICNVMLLDEPCVM